MRRLANRGFPAFIDGITSFRYRWCSSSSKQSSNNDDDFVTEKQQPCSSSAAAADPVLGVVREANHPQHYVERSRLGISVEKPRNGNPPERENSRALTLVEINEQMPKFDEFDNNSNKGHAADSFHEEAKAEMKSELPFDDEEFAETILAMEVEGALDEAWQDSKKAHLEDVKELVEVLKEMRVRNIAAIDVSQKTSNFDYLVNGTCEGARHIHLAAWAVSEADKNHRVAKIPRQKTDHLWEVVAVGRIVVNLMQESYRNEINLERKWAVTKSMDPLQFAQAPVSEGRHSRAHGLWTLTLNLQDLEDFEVDYCKDVLLSQR